MHSGLAHRAVVYCGGVTEDAALKSMKIVIASTDLGFEVRIIDDRGVTTRKFTYNDVKRARRAADAWSAAYGDCPVIDQTEGRKP